ncbi:Serine/threonine-protein phosphatase [Artemisia annua]|uniref:Serine/threonine-protein phosphatase n=1 Tax=Artemisia annua TaxID=35608 RepID=A0A2U1NXY9_ARTAN|nr:Serine/threonine-protein phosphatase [Artemisia annua]
MKELCKIAMASFQADSDEVQKLARDFFRAMDSDGDGKIDETEFLEFMQVQGYCDKAKNLDLFKQLDLDGNRTLDFDEVMTLYYIIKSGRPFCDYCKEFIPSTYFTCVGCLEEDPNKRPSYVCLDCFTEQKCDHHKHNDLSRFVDNYSLLEAMKKSAFRELARSRSHPGNYESYQRSNSTTHIVHNHISNNTWNIQNNSYQHSISLPAQYPAPSTAIVPQRQKPWMVALNALNVGLELGAIGSTFCSIL